MKLLLFDDFRLGVLKGDRVVDVSSAAPRADGIGVRDLAAQAVMEQVIEGFASYKPKFEEIVSREAGVPLADVKACPPLLRPHHILCAFSNYRDRDQPAEAVPTTPLDFFHKGATSIIGDGGTVVLPEIPEASVFQPEPEFAYVIGRRLPGKVSEAEALDYVFGYTNFVDVSCRGVPNRRTTFIGKALNTWAPLGPVITTKDEIPDPQNVRVRLWHNGEQKQDYNTSFMNYSVRAQIAWLSQYLTLGPGDVISCGVHHRGLTPINDGDRVEMEVEGCGRLHFTVKSFNPPKTEMWRPPGVTS